MSLSTVKNPVHADPQPSPSAVAAPEPPRLAWRVWPAVERPAAALGAIAIITIFSVLIGWSFQSSLWGLFSAAVLVLALNRFFLPSRFEIDAEGVRVRWPLQRQAIRWADVRRSVPDWRGVQLSTRAVPSRFDSRSSVHILFGRSSEAIRARVMDELRSARQNPAQGQTS